MALTFSLKCSQYFQIFKKNFNGEKLLMWAILKASDVPCTSPGDHRWLGPGKAKILICNGATNYRYWPKVWKTSCSVESLLVSRLHSCRLPGCFCRDLKTANKTADTIRRKYLNYRTPPVMWWHNGNCIFLAFKIDFWPLCCYCNNSGYIHTYVQL